LPIRNLIILSTNDELVDAKKRLEVREDDRTLSSLHGPLDEMKTNVLAARKTELPAYTSQLSWAAVSVETETMEKFTCKESLTIVDLAAEKLKKAIPRLSSLTKGDVFVALLKKISESLQPSFSLQSAFIKKNVHQTALFTLAVRTEQDKKITIHSSSGTGFITFFEYSTSLIAAAAAVIPGKVQNVIKGLQNGNEEIHIKNETQNTSEDTRKTVQNSNKNTKATGQVVQLSK
jgi:hypothetical protein